MNKNKELKWNELKKSYKPSDFSFTTTQELTGNNELLGQHEAYELLEFGLKMKKTGYNLFVVTNGSIEREEWIKKIVQQQARKESSAEDVVYLYNFKVPSKPQVVFLKPGVGISLKEDLQELIEFIINELPLRLRGMEIRKKEWAINNQFEMLQRERLSAFYEMAQKRHIQIQIDGENFHFLPFDTEGKILEAETYSYLSVDEKQYINQNLQAMYQLAEEVTQELLEDERQCKERIKGLYEKTVMDEVGIVIQHLKRNYSAYRRIQTYLDDLVDDLIEYLDLLTYGDEEAKLLWTQQVKKYHVNLCVSHEKENGAPVIIANRHNLSNLTGKFWIRTEANGGVSHTSQIDAGLFQKANGGYLLLELQDLLEVPGTWETIKKVLKTGMIQIEYQEEMGLTLIELMRPERIEAHIKVILIGSQREYEILKHYDMDFKRFFKVKVEFDEKIKTTKENIECIAKRVAYFCEKEKMSPVTIEALLKIVEYGKRQNNDEENIVSNMDWIFDLIREADEGQTKLIDEKCIQKVIGHRKRQNEQLQNQIDERILKSMYLIKTSGRQIGRVNGLAVYETEEGSFGNPVCITATTYRGRRGIIDIEKEAGLGGNIHSKGIEIIGGFLGSHFAQNNPLSLNCQICFEQSYVPIDGDSASSAELYAILSSLSGIAIKQYIAVTGSVNQFGEIQPIGGVNEKIEGFFRVCQKKGLKGNEGVMIPLQNCQELCLGDEVIEAVKQGKFHIYPIGHIWQGMECLTDGRKKNIAQLVQEKLLRFNQ